MKKLLAFLLALLMALSLAACGAGEKETDGDAATPPATDGSAEIGENEADADPPATDGSEEIGKNEANDETKDEDLPIEYEAFVIHPAVLDDGQVQVCRSAAEANAVLESYDALMKGEIEIFLSLKESALEKILTQWMDFYMSSAKVFGSIDAHSFEEYTLVLVGIRRPSLDEPTVELNMKDGKLQLDIGIQLTEMNMDSQSGLASTLAVWVKRTDIVSVETTTNWSDDTALENDNNSPKEPVSVSLEWFFPFTHDHPNVEDCDGKECLKIQIVRDTETVQTYLDMMMERTAEAIGTFKDFLDKEWNKNGTLAKQLEHYKRSVIALGHCDQAYFENYDLILIHTCNPNFGYDKADMTCQVIEGEGKKQLQVDIVYKELGFPNLRMPIIIALYVDKSLGIESADDIILETGLKY